jgi:hypothetical protein
MELARASSNEEALCGCDEKESDKTPDRRSANLRQGARSSGSGRKQAEVLV